VRHHDPGPIYVRLVTRRSPARVSQQPRQGCATSTSGWFAQRSLSTSPQRSPHR